MIASVKILFNFMEAQSDFWDRNPCTIGRYEIRINGAYNRS